MTSNHLDLDLEDLEEQRNPWLSECKYHKKETECKSESPVRCKWQPFKNPPEDPEKPSGECVSVCSSLTVEGETACNLHPPLFSCQWTTKNQCQEYSDCHHSVKNAFTANGHRNKKNYRMIILCLERLGFTSFEEDTASFQVDSKDECNPEEFSVTNPIDCIGKSQHAVTLEVKEPNSKGSEEKIFKCRRYTQVRDEKSFSDECLGGQKENPEGDSVETGVDKLVKLTAKTSGTKPILFAKFEPFLEDSSPSSSLEQKCDGVWRGTGNSAVLLMQSLRECLKGLGFESRHPRGRQECHPKIKFKVKNPLQCRGRRHLSGLILTTKQGKRSFECAIYTDYHNGLDCAQQLTKTNWTDDLPTMFWLLKST